MGLWCMAYARRVGPLGPGEGVLCDIAQPGVFQGCSGYGGGEGIWGSPNCGFRGGEDAECVAFNGMF